MQEKTWQRIGIGASIVGAVGGIAYLLSKSGTTVVTAGAPYSPTPGAVQQPGVQAIGIPGPPGPQGKPGTQGATGSQTGLQAAAQTPPMQQTSPSAQSLTQYFADQFFGPSTLIATTYQAPAMTSNIPPGWDQDKTGGSIIGNGSGPQNGCGCASGGGSGACGGGKCPNTPGALKYPDGAGSCAATGPYRLQRSMDRCAPGNLERQALNMVGNTQYGGAPDLDLFYFTVRQRLGRLASPNPSAKHSDLPNKVPASRFGAA